LRPLPNADDDKCPTDTPTCRQLPGNEPDIRKAWDNLPKGDRIYGWDGTSNAIPAEVLDNAGVQYTMPPGAIGTGPIPPVIVIPLPGGNVVTFPRR
jgi:hypothetical protein